MTSKPITEKRLCAVQSKISCILATVVKQSESTKRAGQSFSVEATNELSPDVLKCDFTNSLATEKFDGTCCHVRIHKGQPILWARLDRKPNKSADKKFKSFKTKHRKWQLDENGKEPTFTWKFPDDLKPVPGDWIPADDIQLDDDSKCPIPDSNGHVPGWVPVDKTNPQYCWHSTVVDYDAGIALTLKLVNSSNVNANSNSLLKGDDNTTGLEISPTLLADLVGETLELIGTNVNGNPYRLGSKQKPFHVLVEHGCVPVTDIPKELSYEALYSWFTTTSEKTAIEGVVWHLANGKMFKLHRHHLKLSWPLKQESTTDDGTVIPHLCKRSVTFMLWSQDCTKMPKSSMFNTVNLLKGQSFSKFSDVFTSNST